MKTIIKVLKSNGWKYDKASKAWSHRQHDFKVYLDDIMKDKDRLKDWLKFGKLYQKNLYVTRLKDEGKFIPHKKHKKMKEKWQEFCY